MDKGKFRWILAAVYLMIVVFFAGQAAEAVDPPNSQDNGGVQVYLLTDSGVSSGPVFTEGDCAGGWAPGYSTIKSFYINNPSDEEFEIRSINMYLELKNSTGSITYGTGDEVYKDFIKYVGAKIENAAGDSLYNDNLQSISSGIVLNNGYIIKPDESRKFNFTMWMDKEAGNDLQGVVCKFDLILTYRSVSKPIDNPGDGGGTVIVPPVESNPTPDTPPAVTPTPGSTTEPIPGSSTGSTTEPQTSGSSQVPSFGQPGNLPETGSSLDFQTLVMTGILIVGVGLTLLFRKNK